MARTPAKKSAKKPARKTKPARRKNKLLTQADINRKGRQLSNWGKWGKNDQLGACVFQMPGLGIQNVGNATPVTLVHAIGNRRKIKGAKEQVWRMQSAKLGLCQRAQGLVIEL